MKGNKTQEKKARVKSAPMSVEKLEQLKLHLKESINALDVLENPVFVASMHKNLDMAMKKVNQKYGSAKKTEILKAVRDGKEVTIL